MSTLHACDSTHIARPHLRAVSTNMKPRIERWLQRLKAAVESLMEASRSNSDVTFIKKTDEFVHEGHWSKLGGDAPGTDCSSDFDDSFDFLACQALQSRIEMVIKDTAERHICCQLFYPSDLMSRISQDIFSMSVSEPCGVQGCVLHVILKGKDKSITLGTVYSHFSSPPTFTIYLTFKEDLRAWRRLQKIYYTIKGHILNSQRIVTPRFLCSAYQLEKRKLYRGAAVVDSLKIVNVNSNS